MDESLKAAQSTWNVYFLVCVSALALILPMRAESRFALAQKELLLLKEVEFASNEAFVRDTVNDLFWNPSAEYPRTKKDVLFARPPQISCRDADLECVRVHRRSVALDEFKRRLLIILKTHDITLSKFFELSASALFPFDTERFNLIKPLDALVSLSPDLYVLKPDLDLYFRSLNQALLRAFPDGKPKTTRLELIALPCEHIPLSQFRSLVPRSIGVTERSSVPGVRVPVFIYSTESHERPLVPHRCNATLRDSNVSTADLQLEFLIRGRVVKLDWYGHSSWLDKNIKQAELNENWRTAAVRAFGDRPFFDEFGFLPYTRKVWQTVKLKSLDEAVSLLEEKRSAAQQSFVLFNVSIPAPTALLLIPFAVVVILVHLHVATDAVLKSGPSPSSITRSTWVLLSRSRLIYTGCILSLVGLPIVLNGVLVREVLLRTAEVSNMVGVLEVLRGARNWIDAPPYWRREVEAASDLLKGILVPAFIAMVCTIACVAISWRIVGDVRKLRALSMGISEIEGPRKGESTGPL